MQFEWIYQQHNTNTNAPDPIVFQEAYKNGWLYQTIWLLELKQIFK